MARRMTAWERLREQAAQEQADALLREGLTLDEVLARLTPEYGARLARVAVGL